MIKIVICTCCSMCSGATRILRAVVLLVPNCAQFLTKQSSCAFHSCYCFRRLNTCCSRHWLYVLHCLPWNEFKWTLGRLKRIYSYIIYIYIYICVCVCVCVCVSLWGTRAGTVGWGTALLEVRGFHSRWCHWNFQLTTWPWDWLSFSEMSTMSTSCGVKAAGV